MSELLHQFDTALMELHLLPPRELSVPVPKLFEWEGLWYLSCPGVCGLVQSQEVIPVDKELVGRMHHSKSIQFAFTHTQVLGSRIFWSLKEKGKGMVKDECILYTEYISDCIPCQSRREICPALSQVTAIVPLSKAPVQRYILFYTGYSVNI